MKMYRKIILIFITIIFIIITAEFILNLFDIKIIPNNQLISGLLLAIFGLSLSIDIINGNKRKTLLKNILSIISFSMIVGFVVLSFIKNLNTDLMFVLNLLAGVTAITAGILMISKLEKK